MKKPFLIILLMPLPFLACKKDDSQLKSPCQAITYYLDSYDESWKYIKTETSIHWCKVCAEDLERFKSYDQVELVCNETKLLRLVIGTDTCQNKK